VEPVIGPVARERGFALIIVLWLIVLAALIVTQVTSLGRREARVAFNLKSSAVAEAAADGAVYETIYHLMRQEPGWAADRTLHRILIGGATVDVEVEVEDENGKANLNNAPAILLSALLMQFGVDAARAQALADAIIDWRGDSDNPGQHAQMIARYQAAGMSYAPTGEAFASVDELGLVIGMTPDLLARLKPHLTIDSGGGIDTDHPDPIVAQALKQVPPSLLPPGPTQSGADAVTVDAVAVGPSRAMFERRALVRLSGNQATGYAIINWDRGAP